MTKVTRTRDAVRFRADNNVVGRDSGGKQEMRLMVGEAVSTRQQRLPPRTVSSRPVPTVLPESGTMSDVAVLLAAVAFVSGFQGIVTKGPVVPVCRAGTPCDAPVQVTLLFHRPGHTYRTRSGRDGRYRILLAPGIYTVTTVERIGVVRNITPRAVHVRRAHVDRLDFSIDTGIR